MTKRKLEGMICVIKDINFDIILCQAFPGFICRNQNLFSGWD